MITLYLARHGQTVENLSRIFQRKKAGDGFRRVPAEYCTGCSGQQ